MERVVGKLIRNKIVDTIGLVSLVTGRACGVLYLVAIGLSIYEIALRYVFNAPTVWTNETIMALCATVWLLSVGAVTSQRRHITVTALELLLGARVWARLEKLANVLSMVAAAGLLVACWQPMLSVLASVQTSGSSFNPPTPTYYKTLIVIAAALYFVQLLANFVGDGRAPHGSTASDATDPPATEPYS